MLRLISNSAKYLLRNFNMCFTSQLNQENLVCFPLRECSVVSFLFLSSASHSAFRTNRDAASLSRRAAFLLSVISLTLFIYVLILSCEVEGDVTFLSQLVSTYIKPSFIKTSSDFTQNSTFTYWISAHKFNQGFCKLYEGKLQTF